VTTGADITTLQTGENNGIFIGNGGTSNGTLTMDDGLVTSGGGLHIGENGEGTLNLSNGQIISQNVIFVSRNGGSKATINQTGGTLTGNNNNQSFRLGVNSTSDAVYNISGGTLDNHRHFRMGNGGATSAVATFTISDAANVIVGARSEGDFRMQGYAILNLDGSVDLGGDDVMISGGFDFSGGNNTINFILDQAAVLNPDDMRSLIAEKDLDLIDPGNVINPIFDTGVAPTVGTWLVMDWDRNFTGDVGNLTLGAGVDPGWSLDIDMTNKLVTVSYVPEPATGSLLVGGLAMWAVWRRRRA